MNTKTNTSVVDRSRSQPAAPGVVNEPKHTTDGAAGPVAFRWRPKGSTYWSDWAGIALKNRAIRDDDEIEYAYPAAERDSLAAQRDALAAALDWIASATAMGHELDRQMTEEQFSDALIAKARSALAAARAGGG